MSAQSSLEFEGNVSQHKLAHFKFTDAYKCMYFIMSPHRYHAHGQWLSARKSTRMWTKLWLEKVKTYMKHTLMEKVAWGIVIVCLEVLDEEWELN